MEIRNQLTYVMHNKLSILKDRDDYTKRSHIIDRSVFSLRLNLHELRPKDKCIYPMGIVHQVLVQLINDLIYKQVE